jgi:hypothetical protein
MVDSNYQIKPFLLSSQTARSEIFDNNGCGSSWVGSDFISFKDSREEISDSDSSTDQSSSRSFTFNNCPIYVSDNFRDLEAQRI